MVVVNKSINKRSTSLYGVSQGVLLEVCGDNYVGLFTKVDYTSLPEGHSLLHDSIRPLVHEGSLSLLRKEDDDMDPYIVIPSSTMVVPKINFEQVHGPTDTNENKSECKETPTKSVKYAVGDTLLVGRDIITPMGRSVIAGSKCSFLYISNGSKDIIKVVYDNEAFNAHKSLFISSNPEL